MYGTAHCPAASTAGIITEAVQYLIGKNIKLKASFVEYYDGKWRDLATESGTFDKHQKKYHEIEISSIEGLDGFMNDALKRRKTKPTNQNETSSRSHAVLSISTSDEGPTILFVDMAGNEKLDGKDDVKETCFINKSLSQLNAVLTAKARHEPPPYRDNDFTLFLKPYFLKNKVIVFFHVRKMNFSKDLLAIQEVIGLKPKIINRKRLHITMRSA